MSGFEPESTSIGSNRSANWATSSVTRKNRQMSIKVAQNDFTRKMIDFETFTKIA